MKLSDLPQITFADADPEIMEENAVKIMEKLIGRKINRADPVRLFLKAFIKEIFSLISGDCTIVLLLPFSFWIKKVFKFFQFLIIHILTIHINICSLTTIIKYKGNQKLPDNKELPNAFINFNL